MLTLTKQYEACHPEPETVAGALVGVILAQIIFTAGETLEVFTLYSPPGYSNLFLGSLFGQTGAAWDMGHFE